MKKFWSSLPFGAKSQPQGYKIEKGYQVLRDRLFGLTQGDIGIQGDDKSGAWGVVMETGYPRAVVTLVALADGSASLYFSSGGGIIGAGENDGPRDVAQLLTKQAAPFATNCERVTQFPLPADGVTKFYILTFDGVMSAETLEDDLGNNRHVLSPLFHGAHALISEIRKLDDSKPA